MLPTEMEILSSFWEIIVNTRPVKKILQQADFI